MGFPFETADGNGASAPVGQHGPWQRLVAAVCEGPAVLTGAALADRINSNPSTNHFAATVNRTLRELLGSEAEATEAETNAQHASQLVVRLRPEILVSVMQAEPDIRRRRELVESAIRRLSIPAAVRLTSAVAAALERSLSPAMRMMVRKLARATARPETEPSAYADERLRELMRAVTAEWLQPRTSSKAGFEPATHRPQNRSAGRTTPEAERVVQVALECDAMGDAVTTAVHELAQGGETRLVIDMVGQVPETNQAAAAIVRQIATADGLATALRKDPPDTAAADVLLRGLGLTAAKVMLELMVESRSRTTRRYLLGKLAAFGPEIRPLAEGRLRDSRWFVLRNIIALFRATGSPADPATADRLLTNPEARVRREALLWGLESPAVRERAMTEAIANGDPTMLRPALQAARTELPSGVVPVLARRLLQPDFPPELRLPAIQLLGRSGSLIAVEALLHFVQNGTNLLGRPRLAHRTPEMLAALRALARGWPQERRVQPLVEAARASQDSHLTAAVASAGAGSAE